MGKAHSLRAYRKSGWANIVPQVAKIRSPYRLQEILIGTGLRPVLI